MVATDTSPPASIDGARFVADGIDLCVAMTTEAGVAASDVVLLAFARVGADDTANMPPVGAAQNVNNTRGCPLQALVGYNRTRVPDASGDPKSKTSGGPGSVATRVHVHVGARRLACVDSTGVATVLAGRVQIRMTGPNNVTIVHELTVTGGDVVLPV